jgi:zinc protease
MLEPRASWTNDAVTVRATVPVERFADGADLLADVVLHPAFEKASFERTREQDARTFDEYPNDAAQVANRVSLIALFGSHPYGQIVTAARTRAVTLERVTALHDRLFKASRLSVIVAGGVNADAAKAAFERSFGQLPRAAKRERPFLPEPAPTKGPSLIVVDKPGTDSAAIAASFAAPRVGAIDQFAASLAINVYMNGAVGRATVLRDDLKLVPWTETVRWFEHSGGLIGWRAKTSGEHVAPLLGQADAIARDLADKGPTPDEAELIRNWALSGYTAFFATPALVAEEYYKILGNGRPLDALLTGPERIAAVTPETLRDATRKYLDRQRGRIVVVGNLSALRDPLLALGWGPVEIRSAQGDVLRTERSGGGR